tara:strand:+ start:2748 stop:2987 length:240 start_codon:yes stop_codon:yes gene_type:complete
MIKEATLHRPARYTAEFNPVDHVINDAVTLRMYKALQVLTLTPGIREHLIVNDNKALNQAINAADEYLTSYQESTCDNL